MKKWFRWRYVRYLFQALFVGFILNYSWAHQLIERGMPGRTGPIDCICPMGSVAIILPNIFKAGEVVKRSGNTNYVVLIAFVVAILVFGGGFCGWMCPAGTVQEWLYRLRKKIWKRDIKLSPSVHKLLRWFRYVALGTILLMTFITVDFWFKAIDPYNAIFTFGQDPFPWGHETSIIGFVILVITVIASIVIERPMCQYACPLGGVVQPLAKASPTGIVRNPDMCIDCGDCDSQCPYQIKISTVDRVNRGECIQCLRCIDECPVPGALEIGFGWATGGAR